MLRDLVARAAARGSYRQASANATDLLNLLLSSGRLAEALAVAEEMAGYTRRAGLGPWTQLADETVRLQVLTAMGRYDEVLAAVEGLRGPMEALPLESEAAEAVRPWNVREALLDTGRDAALRSGRWEAALTLNAEVVEFQQARGARALEMAHTRFKHCPPLLELGRTADARKLLLECRGVFEAERDVAGLGNVYGTLARLEHETGGRDAAVRFEEVALAYGYQAGDPEDCAIGHHNLANYLERQGADAAAVLAHRLAAAVIRLQTQSGLLPTTLHNLANSDLPPVPPPFAAVAQRVEAVAGVRFRALFERLPPTAPDGDAALAAVWELVEQENARGGAEAQRREEVLATVPPAILAAIEKNDVEALLAALQQLQPQEAEDIVQQLRDTGVIGVSSGPDMAQVLRQFEPLLQAVAAAASDESLRGEIEPLLARLEEQGWVLDDPVHRIWAGERDAAALTEDIDPNSAQLVRRVLELLEE
jgi:hypothetical protein